MSGRSETGGKRSEKGQCRVSAAPLWLWLRERWWLRIRSSVDRTGGRNYTGDLLNEPRYRRFSEGALYGEQPERRAVGWKQRNGDRNAPALRGAKSRGQQQLPQPVHNPHHMAG